jgi:ABC-type branched-subunit amino acid transport system ATPase component
MIPNVFDNLRTAWLDALGVTGVTINAEALAVTGSNASGKSLLRRVFAAFCKEEHGVTVYHVSQEARATGGIQRAFIYGAEDYEATGAISAKTIVKGFATSRKANDSHLLLYDEPELGLSEEAELGVGRYIVEQMANKPEKLAGIVALTHSRTIVKEMSTIANFQFLNLDGMSLDAWLNREVVPISPEEVMEAGHRNFTKFMPLFRKK